MQTAKWLKHGTLRTAHESKRYRHGSKEVQLSPFFSISLATSFRDTRGPWTFEASTVVAKTFL